jgi:hypothetical protein
MNVISIVVNRNGGTDEYSLQNVNGWVLQEVGICTSICDKS